MYLNGNILDNNMEKVRTYRTHEEMWEQIGQSIYDTNINTRRTINDLYEKAMREYKEKSGFNERWTKKTEELKKERPHTSTFPPHMVQLPDDEMEKFNEQYHELGKGLELKVLISLYAVGDKYDFENGNGSDLPFSFGGDKEYANIDSLAQGVQEVLPKIIFWGTKLMPVFYTAREELSMVPEHISNDPESFIQESMQQIEGGNSFPEELRSPLIEGLRNLVYCKDKIRGLTEEECKEFESRIKVLV